MNIGIYFGTQTGTTEGIATNIARQLINHAVSIRSILHTRPEDFDPHDLIILGTSTWDIGELPYDWQQWFPNFERLQLSGKTVALFGVGDQFGYPDTFCDAMGELYRKVILAGADVIGYWSAVGYEFDCSTAFIDGAFVGLVIDEDNQSELTQIRIKAWCAHVLAQLTLAASIRSAE